MRVVHLLSFLAVCVVSLFFFTLPLQADENFSSSLASTYTVDVNGDTQVQHHITITNKTPTLYTKQFALKISSQNIQDLTVISNGKTLESNVVKTEIGTNIAFTFDDEVVGVDKKRTIDLTYTDPDSAFLANKTLAVYIPKFQNSAVYDHYEVILKTPLEFGLPTSTQPTNNQSTQSKGFIVTQFTDLQNEGISAQFGQEQFYNLHLTYHLENTTNNSGITQIALPPDTAYQKMNYQELSPNPESMEKDVDGNWIATYNMAAQSKLPVTLIAKVKVSLYPNQLFPEIQPVKEHLKSQPYWETANQHIVQQADKLPTIDDIYRTVVETLHYNKEVDLADNIRLGAAQSLEQPNQAVCQEFTDTFIALARAKQIPARRLTGFAYSQDSSLRPLSLIKDILHAWPEYFDPQSQHWIQVDPTWEQTTGGMDYFHQFDLNHIVFAINGVSSTTPYPAGTYKIPNQDSKDVEVSFSTDFPNDVSEPVISLQPKKIGQLTISGYYELTIENTTGTARYNTQLRSQVPPNTRLSTGDYSISSLLPFEKKTIPLVLTTNSLLASDKVSLQLQINDIHTDFELTAGPKIIQVFKYPSLFTGLVVGLIVSTLTAGSILVFRRKK